MNDGHVNWASPLHTEVSVMLPGPRTVRVPRDEMQLWDCTREVLQVWELVEHLTGTCGPPACGYCMEEFMIRDDWLGIEGVTLEEIAGEQMYEEYMHPTCPKHGRTDLVGHGSVGPAHDPYQSDKLACGCEISAFGPDPEDAFFVREGA